ncbi:hypothetical protein M3Y99_01686200 [Aphelenchoides fujianensis]|nr:hypothetical protein M3Y99_01686200 [Aphelenchoides fujianensis]
MQPTAYVSLGSRPPSERLVALPPGVRRPYRQLGRPATNRLSNLLAPNPSSALRHGTSSITLSDRTNSLSGPSAPISPASSQPKASPASGFRPVHNSWQPSYGQFGAPHTVTASTATSQTVRVPDPVTGQLRTILNYETRNTKLPSHIKSELDQAYAEFDKVRSSFTPKF